MMKVLIITDELLTADVWAYSLGQLGLEVRLSSTTDPVVEVWETEAPDLIILEDFNEAFEELEICQSLRDLTVVPILYLTSKINEKFQLDIYQAGADECIPYPITPRLFQAKVNAWLRRAMNLPMAAIDEIRVCGFRLDPTRRVLSRPGGEPARLTTLETRLLILLMAHPGRVFSTCDIIEKVWGYHGVDDRNLVKNHIFRLRRKIESDPSHPQHLLSDGNHGYLFQKGKS